MDHRPAIRGFVEELLRKNRDAAPFSDSDSLWISGRLSSLDALELISFLEERYGVDFADRPFDQGEIDSVNQVASLLDTVSSENRT